MLRYKVSQSVVTHLGWIHLAMDLDVCQDNLTLCCPIHKSCRCARVTGRARGRGEFSKWRELRTQDWTQIDFQLPIILTWAFLWITNNFDNLVSVNPKWGYIRCASPLSTKLPIKLEAPQALENLEVVLETTFLYEHAHSNMTFQYFEIVFLHQTT